jgi:hypothetical protein
MKTINIKSRSKMSNSAYHRTGKPTWWAGYKVDGKMTFVKIAYLRGDAQLDCVVEVPDNVTEIFIGAGKTGAGKSCDPYRETISVPVVTAPQCPVCRKAVNLNDIHPTSDHIPADGQYVAYHIGCANGEDCVGGGDMSAVDLDDSRAWIAAR